MVFRYHSNLLGCYYEENERKKDGYTDTEKNTKYQDSIPQFLHREIGQQADNDLQQRIDNKSNQEGPIQLLAELPKPNQQFVCNEIYVLVFYSLPSIHQAHQDS